MPRRPPPSDFTAYRAAIALLGLQPGASIDAVRAAYRRNMRDCHPDRFPNDRTKEAEAKALNAARDLLEQMSSDGRSVTFAMMAERTRRTGGSDTTADALNRPALIVAVIIAPAGMGKTRGWARSVSLGAARRPALLVRGNHLHIILSAPTIALLDQTAGQLAANGVRAPVITLLHSENIKGSVASSMKAYFAGTPTTQEAVLLCSHQAVFDTPLPPDPANWDIVFDEMPDTVTFLSIDAPDTHYHVSRYVTPTPLGDKLYHLSPDGTERSMERLGRIATNRPYDAGLEHLKELARALIHGHTVLVPMAQWDELRVERQLGRRAEHVGHLDILVIVPPIWFQQYRSVTMMGARCLSHFTALIWQKLWQVEFREDNRFSLPSRHTCEQARRLTIHWIFEERATRAFLARKTPNGGKLFMSTCEAVAKFYDGRPFLWSAPQPGEDREHGVPDAFWSRLDSGQPDAFHPALRLPGRTHGLNRQRFLDTCNVALLSVVNLTPAQYELLCLMELTEDEIDRAMAFDVAYQDMARCNIRLIESSNACDVTVLDERTASELADKFPGCRIERYPEELIPKGLIRIGRRGPAPSGKAKSSTERSRAYRARQAALRVKRQETRRET